MGWFIALLGLLASAAGGTAIYFGWPMMPLERGWTQVIAGAALGAGGLVTFAVAMQILETRRLRLVIERRFVKPAAEPGAAEAQRAAPIVPATSQAAPSTPRREEVKDVARPLPASITRPLPEERRTVAASEPEPAEELQPARSFTVGDTTFVVFTDGSIEARTPDGTKRFQSMEEVRAYLEAAVS